MLPKFTCECKFLKSVFVFCCGLLLFSSRVFHSRPRAYKEEYFANKITIFDPHVSWRKSDSFSNTFSKNFSQIPANTHQKTESIVTTTGRQRRHDTNAQRFSPGRTSGRPARAGSPGEGGREGRREREREDRRVSVVTDGRVRR